MCISSHCLRDISARKEMLTSLFYVILGGAEFIFFGWIRRVEYHNNSNGRSGAAGIDVYTGGDIEEKEA